MGQALKVEEPGPVLTPANYRAARGKLARLNRLARAIRRLRRAVKEVLENRV